MTEQSTNKLNPHMTPSAEIEPGPHWWKASAITTRLTLPPNHYSLLIKVSHDNKIRGVAEYTFNDTSKSRKREKEIIPTINTKINVQMKMLQSCLFKYFMHHQFLEGKAVEFVKTAVITVVRIDHVISFHPVTTRRRSTSQRSTSNHAWNKLC